MERQEGESSHHVKRVVLPSGKTIEVVYFKDPVDEETSFRTVAEPDRELHVCTRCASALVYPTDWEEAGDEAWRVSLRCPECESRREGVFSQATVEAFDEQLEAGADDLIGDLRRLYRANMAEEIETFAAALAADAILPEDFRA